MNLSCPCPDWPANIEALNAPIITQAVRSGGFWQYRGKPFAFCPWCGKALHEEEVERAP
jgi:hypothetical protein